MHNFRTPISLLHCIRSGVFLLPQRIGERQSLVFPPCIVKGIYFYHVEGSKGCYIYVEKFLCYGAGMGT